MKAPKPLSIPHGAVLAAALSLTVLTSFWPAGAALAEQTGLPPHRVIVVGGDHNYPPYEFVNADGQPDGYNVEMTKAIAKVMGIEVEIRLGPWDQIREKLESGEIDIVQGMIKSVERDRYFDFAAPYAIISQSIFARKGGPRNITIDGLNGKEVIVQSGGFMQEFLRERAPGAILVTVDTHVDALRLLSSGKHDFAVVAVLPGLYLERKYELTNIEPVSEPLTNSAYGYAVLEGQSDALAPFSAGLAILVNTGRQQKIYDKWLGVLEPKVIGWPQLFKYGAWVFTPLLMVIAGVVVWNNALKKKVAERTRELEDRQQQLVQADKLASLGILTSGVAHEINTPNGLILMNIPVLQEAFEDARPILDKHLEDSGDFAFGGLSYERLRDEMPVMLSDMADSARRIRQIVNDLKSYARQETPGFTAELDLNEVARTAVRLADVSIRKATSRFKADYAVNLPLVRGNAQRLTQVAVNLIVNACQALDGPDKAIELRTSHDAASGSVTLAVSDEGTGIMPEHMARLTDPFFTTKRESGGTGLGLSVSLGIVREHGGDMAFESEPGVRTTVTVTLPALEETA